MTILSFRQAIRTRFAGPTDTENPRVIATAAAGRVVVEWDDERDPSQNHALAARALCHKFGWDLDLAGGCLPDGSYAFAPITEFSVIPARAADGRLTR
jgi:hypothetical protein